MVPDRSNNAFSFSNLRLFPCRSSTQTRHTVSMQPQPSRQILVQWCKGLLSKMVWQHSIHRFWLHPDLQENSLRLGSGSTGLQHTEAVLHWTCKDRWLGWYSLRVARRILGVVGKERQICIGLERSGSFGIQDESLCGSCRCLWGLFEILQIHS